VVLNPGDPVLIETPVYAGILPPLKNLQAKTIGKRTTCPWVSFELMPEVEVDDEGISAENLEQILANWPANEKRPRVV
jgi:tryptophan aminotransferase